MWNRFLNQKVVKFLLGGGVATAINLLLMFSFIELLGFNTSFLRNLANFISIELSLLASFFIYRIWVWRGGSWSWQNVLLKQIPLYHISAGASIVIRVFVVFPLLDWFGVNYGVNTLFGAIISAVLNYIISDRLVFSNPTSTTGKLDSNTQRQIYYPEAFAPALEGNQDFIARKSSVLKRVNLLSIVIPAHNEEGCIVSTVESISQLLELEQINYEILVVNDNSRDRTEVLLQNLSANNPKIRYINNYFPNGFGFAVRCGLENFTGDAVAIVMADNSDSPENIVDYYYKLQEGYDCVFGSRFIRGGKVIDYPSHKLIVNRMANLFIQILFGLTLNDTTNAFKIYRREVIEGVFPLISHHFNLTVEIPLKAIVRGYSYAIMPITWRNRTSGVSKLKLKEMGSRYLFIVLYIWLEKHLSRGDYQRQETRMLLSTKK